TRWSPSKEWDWLAFASTDGSVVVAEMATGQVKHRFADLKAPVRLSADGTRIVAARGPRELVIRFLATGEDIASIPCDDVNALHPPTMSPDGRRVSISGQKAGGWTCDVWSIDAKAMYHLDNHRQFLSAQFKCDGKYLVLS